MLFTLMVAGVERALNQVLRLDPEVAQALWVHRGQVLKFRFTDLGVSIFLRFDQDRIHLMTHYDGEVSAILSGSCMAFYHSYQQGFVIGRGPTVQGNVDLVQDFSEQLQRFAIDWEELLSLVLGDIAAHQVHTQVTDVWAWAKDAIERARLDTAEYVHEEARWVPTGDELEDFYTEVAWVRDAVERAQARIVRLQRTLETR